MELQMDDAKNVAYIKLTGSLTEQILLRAFDAAVASKKYKREWAGFGISGMRICRS